MNRALALFPLLCLIAPATAQGKHLLRYTFQKGQTAHFHLELSSSDRGGYFGGTEVTHLQVWLELHVVDIADGVATIQVRFDRVQGVRDCGPLTGRVTYDSTQKEIGKGPFFGMEQVIGETTTVKVDTQGKVTAVVMPLKGGRAFASLDFDMQQILEQVFIPLPRESVAVGDKWTSETRMPFDGSDTQLKATHTLEGLRQGLATIASTVKVGPAPQGFRWHKAQAACSARVQQNGLPVEWALSVELEIDFRGEWLFTSMVDVVARQVAAPAAGEQKPGADRPATTPGIPNADPRSPAADKPTENSSKSAPR